MKKFVQVSSVLCLVVLAYPFSTGIGYPQDMFAEHITAKKTAAVVQAKGQPPRPEPKGGQQPDCSPNAQRDADKAPARPKNPSGEAGAVKLIPVVRSGLSRINSMAIKVFHLDSGVVEERALPLENASIPVPERPSFCAFLAWLDKGVAFWL
ncbi:MAG: hypothetical protein H7Z75_20180 [Ferruginibacter sp.]|nr:hypothetical protein [Cytophagales bacterium]